MRKIISLVLALAMLMSFAVPAVAAAPSAQEVAGDRLLSLSVIDGYTDGTLGLDKNITRAEITVILAKINGMGDAADLLKDTPSKFSDVKTGEWYTGWINLASSQGWVVGDPQGTFRPNDNVQYREIVTMLLKALGYDDNLLGDWPTNFLAKAAALGITKGIVSDSKAAAVRGDVFVMTSRTLDEKVVSYDKDLAKFVFNKDEDTLLAAKMNFEKVEGVVTSIPRVGSKKNYISIKGEGSLKVVGSVDYEAIFGADVDAWLNDDGEVVFVDIDSDEIFYDAIEVEDDELTLVDADDDYDIDSKADVFINGSSAKISDLDGNDYDYAKVVLNEDGDVAFVDAWNWEDFLVVEKVDGFDVLGYDQEIDAEDYVIVKDGKTVSLGDLKKGDILFYNDSEEYAEVFNKSVEGEISRIYTDRITVEGKDYKYADANAKYIDEDGDIADFTVSNFEDIVEAMQDSGKVAVFLNRAGDMVFLSGDLGDLITSSSYVMVTKTSAQYNNRGELMWTLDVINSEGTVVKYDIKDDDVNAAAVAAGDSILKAVGGADTAWTTGPALTTSDVIVAKTVLELSIDKDGDIDEIQMLNGSDVVVGPNAQIKTSEKYRSVNKIDTDAPIFLVEDYTTDTDDIVVSTYKELDFDYIDQGTFFVSGTRVVSIVVEASDRDDDSTTYSTVATANQDKVSGKNIWRLKLVIDGKKATYDTKEGITNPGVVKGNFLSVDIDDNTGKINAVNPVAGGRVVAAGAVTDVKTADKSFKIAGASFKLGTDAVVVDATDSYNVISLSSLKTGDTASALRVVAGSTYVDIVVRTAKAGDAPVVVVPTDGTVTYINSTFTTVDIDNKPFTVVDDAKTLFTNFGSQLNGAKIAFSTNGSGEIYKITAIEKASFNVNVANMPISGITFSGDVNVSANTGASGTPIIDVTVNKNLTVSGAADLYAKDWHVKGTTTVSSTGTVSFNSELDGNVTVSAGTAVTFTNVEFGGNLAVSGGAVTVTGGSVAGNVAKTGGTVNLAGKLTVDGDIVGTIDSNTVDAEYKEAIDEKMAEAASLNWTITATDFGVFAGAPGEEGNEATIYSAGISLDNGAKIEDVKSLTVKYFNGRNVLLTGNLDVDKFAKEYKNSTVVSMPFGYTEGWYAKDTAGWDAEYADGYENATPTEVEFSIEFNNGVKVTVTKK